MTQFILDINNRIYRFDMTKHLTFEKLIHMSSKFTFYPKLLVSDFGLMYDFEKKEILNSTFSRTYFESVPKINYLGIFLYYDNVFFKTTTKKRVINFDPDFCYIVHDYRIQFCIKHKYYSNHINYLPKLFEETKLKGDNIEIFERMMYDFF